MQTLLAFGELKILQPQAGGLAGVNGLFLMDLPIAQQQQVERRHFLSVHQFQLSGHAERRFGGDGRRGIDLTQ